MSFFLSNPIRVRAPVLLLMSLLLYYLVSSTKCTSYAEAFSFSFRTASTCFECSIGTCCTTKKKLEIMKSIRSRNTHLHLRNDAATCLENNPNSSSANTTINILCLHGKGNNEFTFQQTLEPFQQSLNNSKEALAQQLSFHFNYITAPFPMEMEDQNKSEKIDEEEKAKPMQWWTLPPGVRSFNAKEYQGFQISQEKVMNELRSKKYDFVLGHSQGAILLAALMATTEELDNRNDGVGYILNGAAWPNPYTHQMENYRYSKLTNDNDNKSQYREQDWELEPHVLFIIGEKDKINPPEGAIRTREAFIKGGMNNVQSLVHPGGHSVPVKNEDALAQMTKWVLDIVSARLTH